MDCPGPPVYCRVGWGFVQFELQGDAVRAAATEKGDEQTLLVCEKSANLERTLASSLGGGDVAAPPASDRRRQPSIPDNHPLKSTLIAHLKAKKATKAAAAAGAARVESSAPAAGATWPPRSHRSGALVPLAGAGDVRRRVPSLQIDTSMHAPSFGGSPCYPSTHGHMSLMSPFFEGPPMFSMFSMAAASYPVPASGDHAMGPTPMPMPPHPTHGHGHASQGPRAPHGSHPSHGSHGSHGSPHGGPMVYYVPGPAPKEGSYYPPAHAPYAPSQNDAFPVAPSGMQPPFPQGMGPQGMGPQGMSPQGMGFHGMGPQGMSPQGMGPPGMGFQGMVSQGMQCVYVQYAPNAYPGGNGNGHFAGYAPAAY